MTLIQVIDNARNILNEPLSSCRTFPDDTSNFYLDSVMVNYANIVQQEVGNELIQTYEDFFLTSTDLNISANVAAYTLPTRFVKMRRVEDLRSTNDPVEIYPTTLNEKNNNSAFYNRQNLSGTYWVGGYYLNGNNITFTDTPTFTQNSSVRLHYIATPYDLCAASDVSDIPAEHHKVLVWGLVKYALWQRQADTTLADLEFEKQLVKMKQQAEDRQIQKPRKVKTGRRNF